MGLLDTLADTSVPLLSIPSRLLGGENRNDRLRNFAEKEYPAIAQQFADATTEQEINRAMDAFTQRSMRAGLRPEQMKELAKHLVEPAMRNLGANEIGKLTGQLQGQPEAAPMPGAEGPTRPATPGRNPTPADMFKMAEIQARTGVQAPANFSSMVAAPALIEQRQAEAKMHEQSQKKTAAEIATIEGKQKAIENLPNEPIANTGVSARALGQVGGLGQFVTQSMPQRGGTLDEERRGLIAAQTARANAGAEASRARAGAAGREGKGSQAMQDFIKQGGDPNDIDAFVEYVQKLSEAKRKPTEVEAYLKSKGKGASPAKPGKKRSLEDIARDAFK